jgi:hypothetical protein
MSIFGIKSKDKARMHFQQLQSILHAFIVVQEGWFMVDKGRSVTFKTKESQGGKQHRTCQSTEQS